MKKIKFKTLLLQALEGEGGVLTRLSNNRNFDGNLDKTESRIVPKEKEWETES